MSCHWAQRSISTKNVAKVVDENVVTNVQFNVEQKVKKDVQESAENIFNSQILTNVDEFELILIGSN